MSSSFSDIYYVDNQFNSNFPVPKNGSAKVKHYFVKSQTILWVYFVFLYFCVFIKKKQCSIKITLKRR